MRQLATEAASLGEWDLGASSCQCQWAPFKSPNCQPECPGAGAGSPEDYTPGKSQLVGKSRLVACMTSAAGPAAKLAYEDTLSKSAAAEQSRGHC